MKLQLVLGTGFVAAALAAPAHAQDRRHAPPEARGHAQLHDHDRDDDDRDDEDEDEDGDRGGAERHRRFVEGHRAERARGEPAERERGGRTERRTVIRPDGDGERGGRSERRIVIHPDGDGERGERFERRIILRGRAEAAPSEPPRRASGFEHGDGPRGGSSRPAPRDHFEWRFEERGDEHGFDLEPRDGGKREKRVFTFRLPAPDGHGDGPHAFVLPHGEQGPHTFTLPHGEGPHTFTLPHGEGPHTFMLPPSDGPHALPLPHGVQGRRVLIRPLEGDERLRRAEVLPPGARLAVPALPATPRAPAGPTTRLDAVLDRLERVLDRLEARLERVLDRTGKERR